MIVVLLILLLQSKRISFFPDSALDVYKDMAAGTAQVNALADFLQESEDNMKTIKPYFEGEGYNLDYTIPMHPSGEEFDSYDYSKSVEYDYSNDDTSKYEKTSTYKELIINYIIKYYDPKQKVIRGLDKENNDDAKIINERIQRLVNTKEIVNKLTKLVSDEERVQLLNNLIDYNTEVEYTKYKEDIKVMYEYVNTQKIPQEDSGSLNPLVDGYVTRELCPLGNDEDRFTCIKRTFDCDTNAPWADCDKNLKQCEGDICKYDNTGKLIKRFTAGGVALAPSPSPIPDTTTATTSQYLPKLVGDGAFFSE